MGMKTTSVKDYWWAFSVVSKVVRFDLNSFGRISRNCAIFYIVLSEVICSIGTMVKKDEMVGLFAVLSGKYLLKS